MSFLYQIYFSKDFIASKYSDFLKSFSQTDVDEIVRDETALKMAIVRHPFSRFVSAWAQKFHSKGKIFIKY